MTTELLLHFDGLSGSTTFTDSSGNGHVFAQHAAAVGPCIDTSNWQFGAASLRNNNNSYNNYIVETNSLMSFGTGDFTVECWIKTIQTSGVIIGQAQGTCFGMNVTNHKLQLSRGSSVSNSFTSTTSVDDGAWHAVCISRTSGVTYVFVDGNLEYHAADTTNYTNAAGPCIIGEFWYGYIDELRVSNVGLYTTSYTPAVAPFPGVAATGVPDMNSFSNYLTNQMIDQVLRAQTPYAPASVYVALLVANEGVWVASTTYGAASYMTVLASDGLYHLYYSSAGGTGSGTPTFPGLPGESVTDGTITWVEQTYNLKANTAGAINEPTIGANGYARQGIVSGLTTWAGTQGAGTTTASTGTSGQTSNNSGITYPQPTGNWAAAPAVVWGVALYDASSAGNLIFWGPLTSPQSVTSASVPPSIPVSDLTFTLS